MKKKAFSNSSKSIVKLKAAIKVMTLLQSPPKMISRPKYDPEDPDQIHAKIRDLNENEIKGSKSFQNMEIRGAK